MGEPERINPRETAARRTREDVMDSLRTRIRGLVREAVVDLLEDYPDMRLQTLIAQVQNTQEAGYLELGDKTVEDMVNHIVGEMIGHVNDFPARNLTKAGRLG